MMNVLDSKLKGSGTFPAWVPWQDKLISLHSSGCWCHPPDKRLHKFCRFLSNSGRMWVVEGKIAMPHLWISCHVNWDEAEVYENQSNLKKQIKGDLPKETWKIRLFQSCLGAVWYWATSYRERKLSEITQLYLQMKLEPLRVCCEMFRRKKKKKYL